MLYDVVIGENNMSMSTVKFCGFKKEELGDILDMLLAKRTCDIVVRRHKEEQTDGKE